MEIVRNTGSASFKVFVEKSIGSIIFYSSLAFKDFSTEKIRVYVDRNGQDNKQITKNEVPIQSFILACTSGTDAITSFPLGIEENWKTVAVLELVEGGALELGANDKLRIEMSGLDVAETYIFDGVEEPVNVSVNNAFEFEEKQVLSETKVTDINTVNFDVAIIDDVSAIDEIQYRYSNGRLCTYTKRELRALAQDTDPVGYVTELGTVVTAFSGLLQLPLYEVDEITIKKQLGTAVNFLMRKDMTIDQSNENY